MSALHAFNRARRCSRDRSFLLSMVFFTLVLLGIVPAQAARTYSTSQSPVAGTGFAMASTQSLSYTITNTATAPNTGERIYEVRFRLVAGTSTFSGTTAAPAGWTRTALTATTATFQATSWANAIALGNSVVFPLAIVMTSAAADAAQTLRDARGRFTTTTTGPPFTRLASVTTAAPGSWSLQSLAITSFQVTDTLGTPISAITAGSSFQVRMTVKNNSTATQATVASNPNPPTGTWVGSGASPTCAAGGTLSLVAGASGTIIFSCTSVVAASGTISFAANARNGAGVTSASATSSSLAVSRFNAGLALSPTTPTCFYVGETVTVVMTITNNTGSTITAITGSLTPAVGAPVTAASGPTPASVASLATGGSTNMTWTYTVNSTGTLNPFSFSGSASGTLGVVLSTPTATLSGVSRGVYTVTSTPTLVNAGSTNSELEFDLSNGGCANVNSVAITPATGWTYNSNSYSLVNLSASSAIETWTVAGVGPITFTAPNLAGQLPQTFSGSYTLGYSATPSAATTSAFTVRVTDANAKFSDITVNLTVNAYKTGTSNSAATQAWREDVK